MTLLYDQRKWRDAIGATLVAASLIALPAIAAASRDEPSARPSDRREPANCKPEIGPPAEDASKDCSLPKGDAPAEDKRALALRLWILKSISLNPIWFLR
jgi:hypothetical protein